ncbi:hypothetical protein GCM10007094_33670 [Pseudovibrio japonicus]|uniref:Class I SAM-dependent methyltransferase n=1 Tax=Pseudovibrio japonicus TaxID=366534 RepID=A0ABQ3EIN1_9HYPH|nr:hypothetical protein [Pseudovibrio japonicus]GHB41495.1 hypothetical protein GCM10007094_33670 [Pseudovibrio japonicus]
MHSTFTTLTFPQREREFLETRYKGARTILEYGSGGSSYLAASQPDKLTISVESDREWAVGLQSEIDVSNPPSQAIVYHVDIGPTGQWGRPIDETSWQRFHHYPVSVWDEPFFRHPDLVLIDGRFRLACFATVVMRITRPVLVLFDDYVDRPSYHVIKKIAEPTQIVGRMAEFRLLPEIKQKVGLSTLLQLFATVTYADPAKGRYNLREDFEGVANSGR